MYFNGDKDIEERIKKLSDEVKEKRDKFPPKSEEKKYYRKISKCLDNLEKILNKIN